MLRVVAAQCPLAASLALVRVPHSVGIGFFARGSGGGSGGGRWLYRTGTGGSAELHECVLVGHAFNRYRFPRRRHCH